MAFELAFVELDGTLKDGVETVVDGTVYFTCYHDALFVHDMQDPEDELAEFFVTQGADPDEARESVQRFCAALDEDQDFSVLAFARDPRVPADVRAAARRWLVSLARKTLFYKPSAPRSTCTDFVIGVNVARTVVEDGIARDAQRTAERLASSLAALVKMRC